MPTHRDSLAVPGRPVIVTEGPASQAVIESLCRRVGVAARVLRADGKNRLFKDFARLLAVEGEGAHLQIVVPDLHPETDCEAERLRWRQAANERRPLAEISLAVWETESWLIADPATLSRELGLSVNDSLDPESTRGEPPSDLLADLYRRAKGYRRGLAFDKRIDGVRLIQTIDLGVARRRSPSLNRLLRLLGR